MRIDYGFTVFSAKVHELLRSSSLLQLGKFGMVGLGISGMVGLGMSGIIGILRLSGVLRIFDS